MNKNQVKSSASEEKAKEDKAKMHDEKDGAVLGNINDDPKKKAR